MFGYLKKSSDAKDLTNDFQFKNKCELNSVVIHSELAPLQDGDVSVFLLGKIFKCYDKRFNLVENKNHQQIVMDLYKEVGNDFVKLIDGHFQIVIIDNGEVKLFQNRYLALGLYYYEYKDYFMF